MTNYFYQIPISRVERYDISECIVSVFKVLFIYQFQIWLFEFQILGSPATKARKKKVKPRPNGANYNSFKYLLLDAEKVRLQNYNRMWKERHGVPASKDPRAIVHLGDNPLTRPCWSISGHFPSLRRSMGLLWHCQSETIVSPKELLSLMGWPLFDDLSETCGLAEPIEFPDLPRARKYAGNAIHVPTFGVLLFTCLACIKVN